MKKTLLGLALVLLPAVSMASVECAITQKNTIIQSVSGSYSGPITGEASALLSVLEQENGKVDLCVWSGFSVDAFIVCTEGAKNLNLQFNDKSIECAVK